MRYFILISLVLLAGLALIGCPGKSDSSSDPAPVVPPAVVYPIAWHITNFTAGSVSYAGTVLYQTSATGWKATLIAPYGDVMWEKAGGFGMINVSGFPWNWSCAVEAPNGPQNLGDFGLQSNPDNVIIRGSITTAAPVPIAPLGDG